MSALFPISGITSIKYMDAPEHSQRHFSFSALQTFSIFLRGGEVTYRGLCIWFFGFVASILEYSAVLTILAFSNLYRGEFYLSRLMHSTLSCGPNVGERLISIIYLVLQLPLCGKFFKAGKMFTSYSGLLPYLGRLFYYLSSLPSTP